MSDEKTRQPEPTEDTEGHGVQTGSGDESDKQAFAQRYATDTFADKQAVGSDKQAYTQGETDDDDTEGHSVLPPKGDDSDKQAYFPETFNPETLVEEK